jgi:hypothetical protein
VRRYRHTVTFQAATEVRAPSGAVTYTYGNIAGLTDLPAMVVPVVTEVETDRMVLVSDLYQIVVQGDRAVLPEMVALTDGETGVFDVIRVARPTTRHQRNLATVVMAERVAL